jgi:hypothetical protein
VTIPQEKSIGPSYLKAAVLMLEYLETSISVTQEFPKISEDKRGLWVALQSDPPTVWTAPSARYSKSDARPSLTVVNTASAKRCEWANRPLQIAKKFRTYYDTWPRIRLENCLSRQFPKITLRSVFVIA